MDQFFQPRGVISTEYILPAAAVISCGAKLHDYKETGEDPCVRMAVKRGDKTDVKTLFQFHEATSRGEQVKKLLLAYKQLDFGNACALPESHTLVTARRVLVERNHLHLWFQKLITEGIMQPFHGFGTNNTRLAATLSSLGHKIHGARRVADRIVSFYFESSPEIDRFVKAFDKPWGEYDLDEDHPLYHMKGALENRESLIVLLKNASVRVEVKRDGKRFYLPLNASKEKLTEMVQKLNQ